MNRCFYFFICLLCIVSFVCAQPPKGIKWDTKKSGYYTQENGEIALYELPAFSKKTIVTKEQLTPKETGKPLTIRNFFVHENGQHILIYTNSKKVWRYDTRGDYWIYHTVTNSLKQVGKTLPASSLMFAKISPTGKHIAFVSEHNIYVESLENGTIQQVTKDGTDKIINGTFDWAYEEEFGCRDGFRWSNDGKSIAYWQIDARSIKFFMLMNNTDSIYSFNKPVEYPKVGESPSACKIGVVSIDNGKTTWMNIPGDAKENYIPRMEFTPNQNEIIIQQLNRKQNESKIMLVNTLNGNATTIYTETDNAWIDIKSRWNDDNPAGWEFVDNGKAFLWVSEKDGWRHIYKVSIDGKNETLLTKGNYDIATLDGIDTKNQFVYFSASPENATQKYLYRASLQASPKVELISPKDQKGTHNYQVSPDGLFTQ
ncbi:MAG: DPP IV N-terminal domain-containing protein, partial [Chitinophagaceae bacterium]